MILEEFDLNKHIRLEKEESYKDGLEDGEKRFATLARHLIATSRLEDLTKAISDFEYCKLLYQEFNIT